MEILESARKHGIKDEDIMHAVEKAIAVAELTDGAMLVIGPDRSANLLEIVIQKRKDAEMLAIHAMGLRKKYEVHLRQMEKNNG
ncbi:MAG: hypothetical protein HKL80_08285 [Acidimicrobiales bacterium]|nr:hypothetical protein [Acidimicrobiales bacterium]